MKARTGVFALGLGALVACGPAGGSEPLPTVVLDELASSPVSGGEVETPQVVASGIVVSLREAHLAFGTAGVVAAIHVGEGDAVREGQLLAELQNSEAQVQLRESQRALRELTSPSAIAAAQQALATATQTLDTARKRVNGLRFARATDAFIQNLEGEITLAREAVNDATRAFHNVEDRAEDDPERAQALVTMTEAQINLTRLIGSLNWYTGKPSDVDIDLTYANFEVANAAFNEAQWYLAALKGETIPEEASGARLTELQNARDGVLSAQAQLAATRILAPFSGMVVEAFLSEGEYTAPGQAAFRATTSDQFLVETTDLSENDVAKVQVGQAVQVFVLPLNADIPGRVLFVSPVAETLGGDVVYPVTIQVDSTAAGLLAGMSVEVRFGPSP